MATLSAADVATRVNAHNALQAAGGQTGTNAYPFASAGDTIPSSVDLSGINLAAGKYKPVSGITGIAASYAAVITGLTADGVNFDGADLTGATFKLASVKGAMMANVKLVGASLDGSTFDKANLAQADLSGAGATGASFKNVELRNAKLTGVTFGGATPF